MKRIFSVFLFVLTLASAGQAQTVLNSSTCPGSGCTSTSVDGAGTIGVQITGTFSGTLVFEYSNDDTTWYSLKLYVPGSTTPVTSTAATGFWSGPIPGMRRVRVRFSVYTSGSASVYAQTASSNNSAAVTSGGGGGSITGGTCTNQAVTALDTAGLPTCTTLTGSYTDTSIAKTGTDVDTSNQVTATHLAAALPVAQGGTGLATLTSHAIYLGNGTSAPTALAVCGTGTYVRGASAADPVCSTLTLPNAATTGDLVIATGTNVVGSLADVATGNALISGGIGVAPSYGKITSSQTNNTIALTGTDVNTSNQVTVTHLAAALPVNQGGTGLATLTANALYVGNGTSAPSALAVCGTGTYVRGVAASNPICSTLTLPNAATTGDVIVATGTNVVGAVADVATGNALISGGVGVAPTFGKITSAQTDNTVALTGTDINTSNQVTVTHLAAALPVAQGGTSLATLTSHAIYVGNGTSAPTALAVCGTGTYVRGAAAADPVCSTLTLPNAATQGDLFTATGSNAVGSVAAVAAGSYLRSAGTSTVPAYSTTTIPNTSAAGDLWQGTAANTVSALASPAAGSYLRSAGVTTANVWSTLTLPNAATTGDVLTATGTNAIGVVADVAAGSYLRSGGTSTAPAYSTTTLPNTTATGNFLVATATNTVTAVTPAWMTANPANQTGNATATLKMNGLGAAAAPCLITPVATGRVRFAIYGTIANTLTADGVTYKLAYNSGSIPANGAALTGNILGVQQTWTALTGELNTLFHIEGVATGMTLSTAYWFDLQLADVTGGTASATNVVCVATEG